MALRWAASAYVDLRRIHAFLEPVNATAAARAVMQVIHRVEQIPANPRLGERLDRFGEREVRRVLAKDYEVRYEIRDTDIIVLRIFHTQEER
jgi:plasmid stabilization system protein ParE